MTEHFTFGEAWHDTRRSNYNPDTNIHFGVISMHSVPYEYQEEFEQDYGPATCGKCGNPAIDSSDIPEVSDNTEVLPD